MAVQRVKPRTRHVTAWPRTGVGAAVRLSSSLGVPITTADLASISLNVYDVTDSNAVTFSGTLPMTFSVFDDLRQDRYQFPEDNLGYNVILTLPAEAFPESCRQYRAEVIFAPTDPQVSNWKFVVEVLTDHAFSD